MSRVLRLLAVYGLVLLVIYFVVTQLNDRLGAWVEAGAVHPIVALIGGMIVVAAIAFGLLRLVLPLTQKWAAEGRLPSDELNNEQE